MLISPGTGTPHEQEKGTIDCKVGASVPLTELLHMRRMPMRFGWRVNCQTMRKLSSLLRACMPCGQSRSMPPPDIHFLKLKIISNATKSRLAYNLSPSFNWKTAMPRAEQETYIQRLAKLGYCWQFITLAGLHTTALISDQFAKAYSKQGMRAYGELVQEPEMDGGVDVVKHQKWSGANYVDELLKMVQGGVSSTSAMGKGVTEDQFH